VGIAWSSLQNSFDQVVIYGAKGWLGRSALSAIDFPSFDPARVLLVGSKSEPANQANLPCDIYSSSEALGKISKKSLFLNCAYLRREKLGEMSVQEYLKRINEINELPVKLLQFKSVGNFVNLSSGAARVFENSDQQAPLDEYGKSKFESENLLRRHASSAGVPFINCRIFSVSGRYINEFHNLALSSFIQQALQPDKVIRVNSPSTRRTYIDGVDLMHVLVKLASRSKNLDLESGGYDVSLSQLATEVSDFFPGSVVENAADYLFAPDYCADVATFNNVAAEEGVRLKHIHEQIETTIKGF